MLEQTETEGGAARQQPPTVDTNEATIQQETRTATPEKGNTPSALEETAQDATAAAEDSLQNSSLAPENGETSLPLNQNEAMEVTEAEIQPVEARSSPAPNPPSSDRDFYREDTGAMEEAPQEMRLDINHALQYLDSVKAQFEDRPSTYARFLDIMKEFKSQIIDTPVVISRVSELFHGHPRLIEGFNTFLPAGYKIECSKDLSQPDMITVTTPTGKIHRSTAGDQHNLRSNMVHTPSPLASPLMADAPPPSQGLLTPTRPSGSLAGTPVPQDPPPLKRSDSYEPQYQPQPPINQAIDFVNRIKTRYADDPDVYKRFLDILQGYQKDGSGIESAQVHREVTLLFQHRSPDLLEEFRLFLPNQGDGGLMGLAAVGGGDKERRRRGDSKRKRKAPERDARERELAPKSSPIQKAKRIKHSHQEVPSPPPQPRPNIHNDDYIFFDRVKRFLDNRESYDEFLKLINNFTQGIIDARMLLDGAAGFLGDSELMIKLREILGVDTGDLLPEASMSSVPLGWDRNMRAVQDLGYRTSYKKLSKPDSATCSGRDSLCKSVLNDEYILAPEIHPEDGGFIGHKKNVYEEALHRTEEERHEYDFHLQGIKSTIDVLDPLNNKIMQIPNAEERNMFKLNSNKYHAGGVFKAIHQRVLKKIYGRDAGMDVLAAIMEVPAVAIPVVLTRLRQKEEEWKRSQREWNKIWREVDKRNYYKSLDHQGITFKAGDKKMISGRFFVSQIEVARDQERSKRASFVDPTFVKTRPDHQLEYTIDSMAVLQDTLKLCLSYLDRTAGQYHTHERLKIEELMRTFMPTLLGLDRTQFDSALSTPGETAESDGMASDVSGADDLDVGSSRSQRSRRGLVNGVGPGERDLRKKLLKSEQEKSTRGTRGESPRAGSRSRQQSPHISDAMQVDSSPSPYGTRASNGRSTKTQRQPVRNPVFFCNSTIYIFLRQVILLYSRLEACKQLAADTAANVSNGIGNDVQLGDCAPPGLADQVDPAAHFYEHLLHMCEQLFDNELDQATFEDILRYMFGIKAYQMFTVDKLIAAILKQAYTILLDPKTLDMWMLLQRERDTPSNGNPDALSSYCLSVDKLLDPDEQLYRVNWITDDNLLTFAIIGKDDPNVEDPELLNEQWRAYLDSYTKNDRTDGLKDLTVQPFLRRSMPKELSAKLPPNIEGTSGTLEIRICTRTYRIFYVPDTSEYLWSHTTSSELKQAQERFRAQKDMQNAWLKSFWEKNDRSIDTEIPNSTS